MVKRGADQDVLDVLRELARPATFHELATVLDSRGITRSRVHNAIYRLTKAGQVQRIPAKSGMSYTLPDI
jgi:hypothetical protein